MTQLQKYKNPELLAQFNVLSNKLIQETMQYEPVIAYQNRLCAFDEMATEMRKIYEDIIYQESDWCALDNLLATGEDINYLRDAELTLIDQLMYKLNYIGQY